MSRIKVYGFIVHYERWYNIKYLRAEEVLPEELLEEIRQFVDGCAIYIPKSPGRKAWGENTGTREQLDKRNREIIAEHENGESISSLSKKFCLCEDSIRKILKNH